MLTCPRNFVPAEKLGKLAQEETRDGKSERLFRGRQLRSLFWLTNLPAGEVFLDMRTLVISLSLASSLFAMGCSGQDFGNFMQSLSQAMIDDGYAPGTPSPGIIPPADPNPIATAEQQQLQQIEAARMNALNSQRQSNNPTSSGGGWSTCGHGGPCSVAN